MNKKIILLGLIVFTGLISIGLVNADSLDGHKNYTNFNTDWDCNIEFTDVYTSDAKTPREKTYVAPHTEVKQQLNGECFAYASTSAIESSILNKYSIKTDLSDEWVANIHYANERSTSEGGYLPLVVENIEKHGIVMDYTMKASQGGFEADAQKFMNLFDNNYFKWEKTMDTHQQTALNKYATYKTLKVDGHYVDITNVALMKKAIKEFGGVVCAVAISDSVEVYYNNVNDFFKATSFKKCSDEYQTRNYDEWKSINMFGTFVNGKSDEADHAVEIIGWNDYIGAWIFKNSYGQHNGGDGGYGMVKYNHPSLKTDQYAFVFDVEVKNHLKPIKIDKKVSASKTLKFTKKQVKTLKKISKSKKLNKSLKFKLIKKTLKSVKKLKGVKISYTLSSKSLKLIYSYFKPVNDYKII